MVIFWGPVFFHSEDPRDFTIGREQQSRESILGGGIKHERNDFTPRPPKQVERGRMYSSRNRKLHFKAIRVSRLAEKGTVERNFTSRQSEESVD